MTDRDPAGRMPHETVRGGEPQWADRYAVASLLEALDVPDRYREGLTEAILGDPRAVASARAFASLRESVRRMVVDLESTPTGPDLGAPDA